MEVVDAQQLDRNVLRWLGRLCRRDRDRERGERKSEDASSAARMRNLVDSPLVDGDRTPLSAGLSTASS